MRGEPMDWKLVLLLSAIGIMMGLLSVKGFTQKIEPFLWLLVGAATSLIISKNTDRPFLYGLTIGIGWAVLNGLIQSAFFDTYVANNPSLQQSFQKKTFVQPRYVALLTAPVIGLMTGLVLGGLSLLLKKLW